MSFNGQHYRVTASIGIALFKGGEEDCETVLKHADNAMYEAKAAGRNNTRIFHSEMQEQSDNRLFVEQSLIEAINNNDFMVFYQPKYNNHKEITSAEALIRWQQNNGDFISPADFIPIAEDTGLIVEIGYQVIAMVFQHTLEHIDTIKKAGLTSISINVSPRQFREIGFADYLISSIDELGLDAELFMLELTEEAVVSNIEKTISTMNKLKRYGFKLSIDDFGTGYSSLRYLKDFPIDELKIDKSFIDHIVNNKDDNAIVRSIITMAQNLNLDVVAEGVEREAQFKLLLENGCHLYQGYWFSKPIDPDAFIKLLK